MSTAGILFGLLGTTTTAWSPPSSDGPPPGQTIGGIPAPYDEMVAALRPTAPPIQTYRVGPGKDYTAIEDAVEAARIRQTAIPADQNRWVHIIVDPGTYTPVNDGRLPAHRHQAFFSASGEPNSVTIAGGWEYAAGPFYIEGFYADARESTGPKYGIHAGGAAGDPMVMVGSTLIHSNNSIGSGWPMGTDGGGGGYWHLYDCTLVGAGTNSRTNNHTGNIENTGFTMIYHRVTANCGLEFNGMGAGAPDELWVIDSTAPWAGLAKSGGRHYSSDLGMPTGPGDWGVITPEPLPGPVPMPTW